MQLRQILRALGRTAEGKAKILDVIKRRRNKLGDEFFWILYYAYYKRLPIDSIKEKLIYSRSDYHNKRKTALECLDILIDDATYREMTKMVEI